MRHGYTQWKAGCSRRPPNCHPPKRKYKAGDIIWVNYGADEDTGKDVIELAIVVEESKPGHLVAYRGLHPEFRPEIWAIGSYAIGLAYHSDIKQYEDLIAMMALIGD